MLKVRRSERLIQVETGPALFEWDLVRGAQLVRCDVKSPCASHHVLDEEDVAPNLTLELAEGTLRVADFPAEVQFGRADEDCFVFTARSALGDIFGLEQRYEVFREGVIFCEFNLRLEPSKSPILRSAHMRFALDLLHAKNLRHGYLSRDPYPKQDVTCIHVLAAHRINLDRHENVAVGHLLPCYGLNVGWEESRYYSNRIELVIEDSTSIGGGMLGQTRTIAGPRDGKWEIRWQLCENANERLNAPFFYRNRWGVLVGTARTEAGTDADPARRNHVMAARICHVMYPYVRGGDDWPWISVPIRQTFYQDAQIAKGNPEIERVDEAVSLGANVLILHQFWMHNGGSNGEPVADYRPHDPEWLKRFVDRAHELGMRVAFYMRGIEQYSMYCDFFEKFLRKDWDGLYVDWCTPFALGFCKTTRLHCSAHNWFTFTRALRKRVGEGGFLIGHAAIPTLTGMAAFDALIAGEFSVMHGGLLASPEISASYSMLSGCGVNLISADNPERRIFSSAEAAALCAGLGYSSHPFMQPGHSFREATAFIQPLWDLWRALEAPPVRLFNPAVGTKPVLTWSDDALHPIIYQAAHGTALVLVTNLGQREIDGWVDVDLHALGLPRSANIAPLQVKGAYVAEINGHRILLRGMPRLAFGGALISESRRS